MEQKLQEALTAVRDGETEKARVLLAEFLSEQPDHVPSWLLLSKLATSDVQKAAFLRKVLAIDPDHAYALSELARMGAAPPPPQATPGDEVSAATPPAEATAEDVAETVTAVEATSRGEDLPPEAAPGAPEAVDEEEALPAFLARQREADDLEAVVEDDVIASLVAAAEAEAEAAAAGEDSGVEDVLAEEVAAEAMAAAEEDAVDEDAGEEEAAEEESLFIEFETEAVDEEAGVVDEEAAATGADAVLEADAAAAMIAEQETTATEEIPAEADESPALAEAPTEPYMHVPADGEADADAAPWMVEDDSLLDLEGWEAAPEPTSAEEATPDAMRQLLPEDDTAWPEDEKVKGPLPDEDFSVKEEIAAMETERKLEAAMAASQQRREERGSRGQPGWLLPALATLTLVVFLLLVYAVITLL